LGLIGDEEARMVKKVIIDCDAGVDDALALILAFHSPELEVKAITGVSGNVPLDLVFVNIRKVLSLIQPPIRPWIAKGAEGPLKGKPVYAYSFHGEDGLGGAEILRKEGEEYWKVFSGRADQLIPEMARQSPGELTLIAIGPLTNLALGLQRDPEGMKKLKEVAIMGGAVRTRGNITPYAEFNFFVDPLAAAIVLESGLPMTLIPLDVTHQVFLTPTIMEERIKPLPHPFSRFVVDATRYDSIRRQFRPRPEVLHLHDPLAIGTVVHPDLVRKERSALRVETEEGEDYGRVSEIKEGSQMEVCLGVNATEFLELFISRLS
jgi:inosine-uridine nucleoside N-ribohydrolase